MSQIAPVSPVEVSGGTLAAVFDAVFSRYPQARGYVPDEHGRVRRHIAVFVDGRQIEDRRRLDMTVAAASDIFVMKALSGG
ncbi:MoaD/ThiS family protein [Chitinivorax sp. PXF-14]|uniref:MoaD/ThiS family protein n=1 Tax=Chitinivorax sp. PXF-14 TaxID=3230488 RepID=UPI003465FF63